MNKEQFQKGKKILEVLEILETAIKMVPALRTKPKLRNDMTSKAEPENYFLTVSKHSDGSGGKLELNGIDVQSMVTTIEKELKRQLAVNQKEFEKL